ncbi:hypothetical protein FJTKL_07392 [Diaporthe vaccinii]|uniref:Uncharacterized protein n=1 Tax=Diaporthe vaccinii TaxID=105482 RepID=A0ABR4ETW0_9PEZI
MPAGLTGEFAYIQGNEVMEQLLSHDEIHPSRNKAVKEANAAFADLEKWMGEHKHYQEALAAAKLASESHKRIGNKKKLPWKAPGLHLPEGLLAVLIISPKIRRWVEHLEIQWMICQPRNLLDVTDGFRACDTPLFADYTELFGKAFAQCQKDIRPFLPHWAEHPNGTASEDDSDNDIDGNSVPGGAVEVSKAQDPTVAAAPISPVQSSPSPVSVQGPSTDTIPGDGSQVESPAASASALRQHLYPPAPVALSELEDWLTKELGLLRTTTTVGTLGDNSVLTAWCRYWENRSSKTVTAAGDGVIRELFIQSLQRLYQLWETPWAAAYMLADTADGSLEPRPESYNEASRINMVMAEYQAFVEAEAQLSRNLPDQAAADLLERSSEAQTCFFLKVAKSSHHFAHWKSVIKFEALRTQIILHGLQDVQTPSHPQSSQVEFWRDRLGSILRPATITALRLTNWQLRSLLAPGADCQSVLTSSQHRLFCEFIDKGLPLPSEPKASARMTTPASSTGTLTGPRDIHANLFKLFQDATPRGTPAADTQSSSLGQKPGGLQYGRRSGQHRLPKAIKTDLIETLNADRGQLLEDLRSGLWSQLRVELGASMARLREDLESDRTRQLNLATA